MELDQNEKEKLFKVINDSSVLVQLSARTGHLQPLINAVKLAITELASEGVLGDKKYRESDIAHKLTTNKVLNDIKEAIKTEADQREKQEQDKTAYINRIINDEDEEKNELRDVSKKFARVIDIATKINNAVEKITEPTGKRFGWLRELENSGVKLTKGFDDSFTELSNASKMTHDEFAKFMTSNSKIINNLEGRGLDGVNKFATATGNIIGKFGLGSNGATTIMTHYFDTIAALTTDEELRNLNLNNETLELAKNMAALRAATGKTVEQLHEELKLKEKNIFSMKMQSSPLRNFFNVLSQLGLSEDIVRSLVTGRMNRESSLFAATPAGQAFSQRVVEIRNGITSGRIKNDNATIIALLNEVLRNPTVQSSMSYVSGMPEDLAAVLSSISGYNTMFGELPTAIRTGLNAKSAENVAKGISRDTESINSWELFQAERKRLGNNINKALSVSTLFAADCLEMFGLGLKGVNALIGNQFMGGIIKTVAGFHQLLWLLIGVGADLWILKNFKFIGSLVKANGVFKGLSMWWNGATTTATAATTATSALTTSTNAASASMLSLTAKIGLAVGGIGALAISAYGFYNLYKGALYRTTGQNVGYGALWGGAAGLGLAALVGLFTGGIGFLPTLAFVGGGAALGAGVGYHADYSAKKDYMNLSPAQANMGSIGAMNSQTNMSPDMARNLFIERQMDFYEKSLNYQNALTQQSINTNNTLEKGNAQYEMNAFNNQMAMNFNFAGT